MTQEAALAAPAPLPEAPSAVLAAAQPAAGENSSDESNASSSLTGIESPDASLLTDEPQPATARTKQATRFQSTIAPDENPHQFTHAEKFVFGFRDSFFPFSMAGWLSSAAWGQWTNGSPNYGTDSGAFGERLGAAALRGGSMGVFSESVLANLFHEDPRYYQMGNSQPFIKRGLYAGTRIFVTRTDGGRQTVNYSLLAGNFGGALLTQTYYPKKNTTAGEIAATYGSSLGGSALGFVVSEFLGDALRLVHLQR
jgi:hypothetical protein